eukprot:211651-Hanusia_phi.AAC.1
MTQAEEESRRQSERLMSEIDGLSRSLQASKDDVSKLEETKHELLLRCEGLERQVEDRNAQLERRGREVEQLGQEGREKSLEISSLTDKLR